MTVLRRTPVRGTGSVRLTFTLPLDSPPGPVSVVGDFNSWRPGAHLLLTRAKGIRSTSVTVAAGTTLRFRYLGPDGLWFDDAYADALDTDGSLVSV
jgi:1,4-alpha-glucan branching enzyme